MRWVLLKNDFYAGWVEARSRSDRVAQNPRNALGFASLNPTYKEMASLFGLH
jgi:hypothetical protein